MGVLPTLALIAGAAAGAAFPIPSSWLPWPLSTLCASAVASWWWRRHRLTLLAIELGFCAAGAALGAGARERALDPSLRTILEERIGGFRLDTLGPEAHHDPIAATAVLAEDAALGDGFVSLRAHVVAIELAGRRERVDGGVTISVSGAIAPERAAEWRAGRTLRIFATFRRPGRYLNDGVPDFERALALEGTTLFASVKSGLLVDVLAHGNAVEEAASLVRAHVRRAVSRRVARHDPVSAGIVTAVLIGDRTGLPDDIRDRLQAAGTYHVIAISGGNIAILAAIALAVLGLGGVRGRAAALPAIVVLLAYAQVVTAGPSVWRATLMAILYFVARALDHGSPSWHVASVAAGLMVVVHPLDVRDPGFVLTFGATAALLEGARRGRVAAAPSVVGWVMASIVASVATEVALLPVSAQAFSRVTSAGLVLNLLAVPLMGLVQIAGLVVVGGDGLDSMASAAGWTAHLAASALVNSARLVDAAPWLAVRTPPPGAVLVLAYYAALAVALLARRRTRRVVGAIALAGAALAITSGARLSAIAAWWTPATTLRLTVLDVGQAEAILLQTPDGRALLVDTGGAPFGGGAFDIGARVIAPALWARGIARLDALLVTHGDPDHLGGAQATFRDFGPGALWEGIEVPPHVPMQEIRAAVLNARAPVVTLGPGTAWKYGDVRITVLHPPAPDWERQRVRNDDSVVLDVRYGEAAFLLTGDIGADVERVILPHLPSSPVRVLKVAHHGSRTSTSRELLEHWRPQVALVSSGRGNTFGHPAPEVLQRLESIGAAVFRTDRDGQIAVETDGRTLTVATFTGGKEELR